MPNFIFEVLRINWFLCLLTILYLEYGFYFCTMNVFCVRDICCHVIECKHVTLFDSLSLDVAINSLRSIVWRVF